MQSLNLYPPTHLSPLRTSEDIPHTLFHTSALQDGQLCVHDVDETRLAQRLSLGNEEDAAINSLVYHPTDPNLLYASVSAVVKAIDLRTGPGVIHTFSHNREEVMQVCIIVSHQRPSTTCSTHLSQLG